jgi:hypothetical protein
MTATFDNPRPADDGRTTSACRQTKSSKWPITSGTARHSFDVANQPRVDPAAEYYLLSYVRQAVLAPLPPDVIECSDHNGLTYYYDAASDTSTRQHPVDLAVLAAVSEARYKVHLDPKIVSAYCSPPPPP